MKGAWLGLSGGGRKGGKGIYWPGVEQGVSESDGEVRLLTCQCQVLVY